MTLLLLLALLATGLASLVAGFVTMRAGWRIIRAVPNPGVVVILAAAVLSIPVAVGLAWVVSYALGTVARVLAR